MSDQLPEWIYEGALVWSDRVRGNWGHTPDPDQLVVVRFTAQRIITERRGVEMSFLKDGLNGIGKASDYQLVPESHPHVITAQRNAAVRFAMERLRTVFTEMQSGNRIGWSELPNALEAAEKFHEASYEAIQGLEDARNRFGEGQRRDERR